MIKCGSCKTQFDELSDFNAHECWDEPTWYSMLIDRVFSFSGTVTLFVIGAILVGVLNHGKGW